MPHFECGGFVAIEEFRVSVRKRKKLNGIPFVAAGLVFFGAAAAAHQPAFYGVGAAFIGIGAAVGRRGGTPPRKP